MAIYLVSRIMIRNGDGVVVDDLTYPPAREAFRAAGAKLGMQVSSAESARADYLVCQGTEAGGHVQATRGLYEALPNVLEEAKQKPVIASGGIGNGEGIRMDTQHTKRQSSRPTHKRLR